MRISFKHTFISLTSLFLTFSIAPSWALAEMATSNDAITAYPAGSDCSTSCTPFTSYTIGSPSLSGTAPLNAPSTTGAYELHYDVNGTNNVMTLIGTNGGDSISDAFWVGTTLSATSSCNVSSPQIQITNIPSNGVASFDVYRNNTLLSPGNAPLSNYTDNTAASNTSYTYYVIAYPSNTNGNATKTGYYTTPSVSVTSSNCSPTLTIQNATTGQHSAAYTQGASGLQTADGGVGWFNPMKITVGASGSGYQSYAAFYDQTLTATPYNPVIDTTTGNPVIALQNQLVTNNTSGFILKYDTNSNCDGAGLGNQYCAWDPNNKKWLPISSFGLILPSPSSKLYTVRILSGNPANTWQVSAEKAFGSKRFYTAAVVINASNQASTTPDASPTIVP